MNEMLSAIEASRLLRIIAGASGAEITEVVGADGRRVMTIQLPSANEPAKVDTLPAVSSAGYSARRILHVEDGDRASDLTHYYLRDLYEVDGAQSAEEALRMALSTAYDVILMDINLGNGMNGFELTGVLRQISHYQTCPIIALTGYSSRSDAERCLAAGCNAYIAKPFLKEDLLRALYEFDKGGRDRISAIRAGQKQ